jgi:hypothetical protein
MCVRYVQHVSRGSALMVCRPLPLITSLTPACVHSQHLPVSLCLLTEDFCNHSLHCLTKQLMYMGLCLADRAS